MRTAGFVISHKENERRRALLPCDIIKFVRNPGQLYIERGYGDSVDVSDDEYLACGCKLVSREEALQCDIIVDAKLGDAEYLDDISDNKILFGWAHAVQGIDFTSTMLKHKHTVIAWEEIFEDGRNIFYRNSEVAGEAAILHAFRYAGKMPYDTTVAILGNGYTAKGALRCLHGLGAKVDVYGRKLENLFKQKMYDYDILVNCILWDTNRKDRIIYKEDLKKMKKGTLIIDISCDNHLEIETSHGTTIDDPIYEVDGVIHYVVDHTPAMYPKTVTRILSEHVSKMMDSLLTNQLTVHMKEAVVIQDGNIIDEKIRKFREERGLPCS